MPAKNTYRVIVDVNIWIQLFRSDFFRSRCLFLLQYPYRVLYSDSLLNELDDVVRRPRHWNTIKHSEYENTVRWLKWSGIQIDVYSAVDVCRDPKDNYLLALAKDGEADYLITDDKDLLVLQQFGKTKIVDLTAFEKAGTIEG